MTGKMAIFCGKGGIDIYKKSNKIINLSIYAINKGFFYVRRSGDLGGINPLYPHLDRPLVPYCIRFAVTARVVITVLSRPYCNNDAVNPHRPKETDFVQGPQTNFLQLIQSQKKYTDEQH